MDYSFDPCKSLASLDFKNPEDLKKILRRDKHTRIEGICTEALFIRDLLAPSFPDYSSSWWFVSKGNRFHILKLVSEIENLSALEFALLSFFRAKQSPAFLITFNEKAKSFFYIKFDSDSIQHLRERWRTHKKIIAPRKPSAPMPSPSERQPHRLDRAMNLMEASGLLKHAAIERLFANCWLASGRYWDIDAFAQYRDQFLAFEVKQKYPTASGTFGLNLGLTKLLSFLSDLGVNVIHVILTKPVSNRAVSAVDLYTEEKYKGLSLWIAAIFNRNMLSAAFSNAPARTSIYGAQALKYYDISPNHFHKLKLLGTGSSSALRDFVEGKTSPLTDISDIPAFPR
jgi:hypothetical protein